jgi:hypothetical protein
VDLLIRGWPFGTFLNWKLQDQDPACALARSFWHVVDRTDRDEGIAPVPRHAPATFSLVLDGHLRIQSLRLAVGGDGWGFKMYDRDWTAALADEKPRGRHGKDHWSLRQLKVSDYAQSRLRHPDRQSQRGKRFANPLWQTAQGGP